MTRVDVAVVPRRQFSILSIFVSGLLLATPASGQSDFEDLRLNLLGNSRLIFVGGAGNPVSLVLGSEDNGTCNPIDDGDLYGITLRVFKDSRSPSDDPNAPDPNDRFDNPRFRVCGGEECPGSTTPVGNEDLSQEDGVARIAVIGVDLPEGACVTDPNHPPSDFFFEFKKACNVDLTETVAGHWTASPTPGVSSRPGRSRRAHLRGGARGPGIRALQRGGVRGPDESWRG